MSDLATQNPFGVNLLSSVLQNTGLNINTVTAGLIGTSHTTSTYTPGTLVTDTCLNYLTLAIKAGYDTLGVNLNTATYGNLIAIGSSTIPALGNSKPPTFTWIGPANTGDSTSTAAQEIAWYPYTATATTNTYPSTNPTPRQWSDLTQTTYSPVITQHGWIRVFALQAWNEFNWNGLPGATSVSYKDFINSFQITSGFLDNSNRTVNTLTNASTFLKNTYSNNNDLMTADLTGVNLATTAFGQDLINTGKVIDLSNISKFGLPSILLRTLNKYNSVTNSLSYALLSSGLSASDINNIISGNLVPTQTQEQQIYGSFSVIENQDLVNILIPLNCTTVGLTSLIDLLNLQKLFPNSYQSLTVPIYNSAPGPTNAKTYYSIYDNGGVNSQLSNPQVIEAIGSFGIAPQSTAIPQSVPAAVVAGDTTIAQTRQAGLAARSVGRRIDAESIYYIEDNGIGLTEPTLNATSNYQPIAVGFGAYSRGTVPDDISITTGAFSFAMQQVTNIQNVPVEKIAQVVFNLETTVGLPLVAGTDVPVNTSLTTIGLDQLAYGSGPNGSYTMSDFFGSMSGLPYQWTDIKNAITQIQTTTLATIYYNIYNTIATASTDVSATVQTYIDSANAEIASILASNPTIANQLNRMWNLTGTQLTNEQRARDIALVPVAVPKSVRSSSFPTSNIGYVNSMSEYAKRTEPHMHSQTLEAISDLMTAGGQSQIALLRSLRNQSKLNAVGIPLDNNIPSTPNALSNKILLGNGTVSTARQNQGVPAGDAIFTIPADSNVLDNVQPLGHFENDKNSYCLPGDMAPSTILGTIPQYAYVGQDLAGPNITQVNNVITPIAGGFIPQGDCNTLNLGNPIVPGSLAGNPYQNLIQPNLSVPYMSGVLSAPAYSVADAINEVVRCNCDCWL